MKVFNRSRRTFNPGTSIELLPGRWTDINDDDAKKLLKSYPRDLTTNEQPTGPTPTEIRLSKENKELKAKLSEYEKQMKGLETIATNPTPPIDAQIPDAPPAPAKASKKAKTVAVV